MTGDTIKGVDVSSYVALQKAGVKFYDNDGTEKDFMQILAENGVNAVRIRVWLDPYSSQTGKTYGGGTCDLANGLTIAKEATKYDMKVLLCLQYSDFWADPAQQHLPKDWLTAVNDPQKLSEFVYQYTKETLQAFNSIDGIDINMVQVGNEITSGFLGTYANRDIGESWKSIWTDEEKSAQVNTYLKAGVKAVREEAPKALVALHLETPNVSKYKIIMDTWERDGVDYDVLGSSYYPFWSVSAKASTPSNLRAIMQLAASYGKLFVVLETAWSNTVHDADGTPNSLGENVNYVYDVSPQGQVDELTDMYSVLTSEGNGLGAYYWEPAWIPVNAGWRYWQENKDASNEYGTGWASEDSVEYLGADKYYYEGEPAWGGSSWDNNALFDMHGVALKSLAFYKEADSGTDVQQTVISIVDDQGEQIDKLFVNVTVGESTVVTLPKITGYASTDNVYKLLVAGTGSGIKHITLTYQRVLVATLSQTAFVYSGKVRRPLVTVQYGSEIVAKRASKSNANVAISYAAGRKKVGTYTVTVKGKGQIADTTTLSFTIKPAATHITKLKAGKKKLTVKWKKKTAQVDGYKIQYSATKSFTKATTKKVTVKSYKTVKKTIKGLTRKKTYYVRVATYKGSFVSNWSAAQKVKVK